jgi:hypothetical protein
MKRSVAQLKYKRVSVEKKKSIKAKTKKKKIRFVARTVISGKKSRTEVNRVETGDSLVRVPVFRW